MASRLFDAPNVSLVGSHLLSLRQNDNELQAFEFFFWEGYNYDKGKEFYKRWITIHSLCRLFSIMLRMFYIIIHSIFISMLMLKSKTLPTLQITCWIFKWAHQRSTMNDGRKKIRKIFPTNKTFGTKRIQRKM